MLEEKYVFYRSKGLDKFADKTANEYFSQMSVVFTHNNDEISDYKTIVRKAIDLYKKDRKDILEKSNLSTFRWIFMKLSYVSIGFIALYGKMLKLYFNIKNYRKSKER